MCQTTSENGFFNRLMMYIGRINETELWGPDVLSMREEHRSEKVAVICGEKHFEFFVNLFEENPNKPTGLEDLKASLSNQERVLLEDLLKRLSEMS